MTNCFLRSLLFVALMAASASAGDPPVTAEIRAIKRELVVRSYHATADRAGALLFTNAAQALVARFDGDGVVVRPAGDSASEALGLRLEAFGRMGALDRPKAAAPRAAGHRIDYDRGALIEWYVNDARGIEQGFTLLGPPSRGATFEPVVLELGVTGTLDGVARGNTVEFTSPDGSFALSYGQLVAVDADGHALPVRLDLQQATIRIVVDDRNARYPLVVDPLTFHPVWSVDSGQAASGFGNSVACAGDVNGDGYDDALVGAPAYTNGETWEGRAYLYLGSASGLATTPSWITEGNQAYASHGTTVAGAGDVNGDGYGDVLVGAATWGGAGPYGRVSLYLGSVSGLATTAAWAKDGDSSGNLFGQALAGAGDLNGDGYDDVVVGSFSSHAAGRVSVYFGSAAGLSITESWGTDGIPGAGFGRSVAGAGDVNGDGFDDLIVGAHAYSNGQVNEGAAYLFLGSAAGPAAGAAWSVESDSEFSLFGITVAGAGDVDADGFDDVIVGAPHYDVGMWQEGHAFLYLGSATGPGSQPAWIGRADQVNAHFGIAVAGAGDVNADGFADVVVGADNYKESPYAYTPGRLFVYLGGPAGLGAVPDWFADATGASKPFLGGAVDGAGDVNGDGFADLIAGGQNFDNGAQAARAYHGGPFAAIAPFGKGKPLPAAAAPRLTSVSPPTIGGTATLDFFGGTFLGQGTFLIVGLAPAAIPFDGASLSVLPFQILFLPPLDQNGRFTFPAAVPALPTLQGKSLYFQAGFVDPASPGPHHSVISNALHWVFGI